jgi:hypothetical protein
LLVAAVRHRARRLRGLQFRPIMVRYEGFHLTAVFITHTDIKVESGIDIAVL